MREEPAQDTRDDAGAALEPADLAKIEDLELEDRRFYSRLRTAIREWAQSKGRKRAVVVDYVMSVPDVFVLLLRLIADKRIGSRSKLMLGAVVAYIVFPFDIMPEGILGPAAYVEDLVLAVYAVSRIIDEKGIDFVRSHWSGREDILQLVTRVSSGSQRVLNMKVFKGITKTFDRIAGGKPDTYEDMKTAEDHVRRET